MSDDFDISKAFEQAYNENKPEERTESAPKRECYPYFSFDLCRSKGTVLGKWIPDAKGRPYKCLDHIYVGSIPVMKDNGSGTYNRALRVCDVVNYRCELTKEQRELNAQLIEQIKLNQQIFDDRKQYSPFRETNKATIFFMFIRKVVAEDGTITEFNDPNVSTMIHRSFNFVTTFNKAISARKEAYEGDTSWMREFFNRDENMNMKFVQILTTRPNIGYETTFDYLELPVKKFQVKSEDLETANDLDAAFINTLTYDEDFYRDSLERLTAWNKELSGVPPMTVYEPNRKNNN